MHKNYKYRRLVERLPEQMKELMRYIEHECTILAHHSGSMGWNVDFRIHNIELSLVYDRGSLIVVKDPHGEDKSLFPEGKNWSDVTLKDLGDEINKEFAKQGDSGC